MKFKELLPFVTVRYWQPRVLMGNEAEGSWEELEINITCGRLMGLRHRGKGGERERGGEKCIVQAVSYPGKNLERRAHKPTV